MVNSEIMHKIKHFLVRNLKDHLKNPLNNHLLKIKWVEEQKVGEYIISITP